MMIRDFNEDAFRTSEWRLVLKFADGHRYFRDARNRIAIADDSGATPDDTDDGVLYLDRSKPVVIGNSCSIPLVGGLSTSATATEAIGVAAVFGMKIRAGEATFTVDPNSIEFDEKKHHAPRHLAYCDACQGPCDEF